MADSLAAHQGRGADRYRARDHRHPGVLPAPVRRAPGGRADADRPVRRVPRRFYPQRAWSFAILGILGAAWGAGAATLGYGVGLLFGLLQRIWRAVRLPVYIMEEVMRVKRTTRQLYQELGREPTTEELSAKMELPLGKVRKVLRIAQEPISLETPVGEEEESHLGDFIVYKRVLSPSEAVINLNSKDNSCQQYAGTDFGHVVKYAFPVLSKGGDSIVWHAQVDGGSPNQKVHVSFPASHCPFKSDKCDLNENQDSGSVSDSAEMGDYPFSAVKVGGTPVLLRK